MISVLISILITIAMMSAATTAIFWGATGLVASLAGQGHKAADSDSALLFGIVTAFGVLLAIGTIASIV